MNDSPGTDEAPKRKRRVRYKGKHPRRFDEKYKELDPVKYKCDIEKIIKSGKTPAGMHRPIVEAVLAGNPAKAALAMKKHAIEFGKILLEKEKTFRQKKTAPGK